MDNKIREIEKEMTELEDLIRSKFARLEGLKKEHDKLLKERFENNN